jgi:hypothetical protein
MVAKFEVQKSSGRSVLEGRVQEARTRHEGVTMTQAEVRKLVNREITQVVNGKLSMGSSLTPVESAFVRAIYSPYKKFDD